jgi:catechol 2,3-dioxygenase-like lactoylglutathione lyase family enzyme
MSFKIDHIAIGTKSFEKLTSWYINNLGFKIIDQWTLDDLLPGKQLGYLEKDGVKLEIIGNGTMVAEAVYGQNIIEDYMIPGYRHFCIAVPDVDAITNDLAAKGVTIVFPATNFPNLGVRASIVTDCDGNTLEFMAPLK